MKEYPEKAPTATETGNYKYYKCERCGKYFSDPDGKNEIQYADTIIPVMTHTLTHVEAVPATCTAPGIKAHVIPQYKMAEVVKDPRFGDTTAFLLFETPQDALEAIDNGVEIKSLNIGSMAHSQGKVAVNKVLSLDAKDVECFEELKKLGVQFDVRKVPADAPENMDKLIQAAKDGLGIK